MQDLEDIVSLIPPFDSSPRRGQWLPKRRYNWLVLDRDRLFTGTGTGKTPILPGPGPGQTYISSPGPGV